MHSSEHRNSGLQTIVGFGLSLDYNERERLRKDEDCRSLMRTEYSGLLDYIKMLNFQAELCLHMDVEM
jgi:hypothetical protein